MAMTWNVSKGFEDLTGKQFGVLKVLKRATNSHDACGTSRVNWFVECQCGLKFVTKARYLKRGSATSCLKRECKQLVEVN